ncbi:MAG: hypothetical protein K0R05_1741 [Anaerocolumna sp.]|jgi:hypothetical protein|nr:hypothetical protein [Anaerocolumna sp.]
MHQELVVVFKKVVTKLKEDSRCKGGWHYGSISRGDMQGENYYV